MLNFTNVCEVSTVLSSSQLLMTELSIIVLFAPVGIVLNLLLIYSIIKSPIFNNNLRILLGHISVLSCWFCLATGVKYVHTIFALMVDPCNLVKTLYDCKVQELATILPIVTIINSLVAVGCERLYATIFYVTYDKKRNIGLTLVLLALIWALSLSLQLTPLPKIPKGYVPICHNLLVMGSSAAVTALLFNIVVESLSVVLFSVTTALDRTKLIKLMINHAQHTLSARFQLSQNVEVNKIMLPTAIFHLACFIPNSLLPLLAVTDYLSSMESKIKVIHVGLIIAEMFTIVHPMIIFKRNFRLRKEAEKLLPFWRRFFASARIEPYTTNAPDETKKHFDYLEQAWN